MSSVQYLVLFNRKQMVSAPQWHQAILCNDFDMTLDADFDPFTFQGFVSCLCGDIFCGFDYRLTGPDSHWPSALDVIPVPASWDTVVLINACSSVENLEAATIAAAVLTSLTQGALYDGAAESVILGDEALAWVRFVLMNLGQIHQQQASLRDTERQYTDAEVLDQWVYQMRGEKIDTFRCPAESLALMTGSGFLIGGSAFEVHTADRVYDCSRRIRLDAEQFQWDIHRAGDHQPPEVLRAQREAAVNEDNKARSAMKAFLDTLLQAHIRSVIWQPGLLVIECSGSLNFSIRYLAFPLVNDIRVTKAHQGFEIGAEGVSSI